MTIADGFLFNVGKWLADIAVDAIPYVLIAALLFVLVLLNGRNT